MSNDAQDNKGWAPPRDYLTIDTPNHLITRGGEKSEGVFSGVIPDTEQELIPSTRDSKGRFLTGNNGGGRKIGAKSKLTETFLSTILKDFNEHGAETLERLRTEDPAFYLKMIAVLIPKNLIQQYETENDYANMTHEEAIELIESAQRKRFIEKAIETVSK